MKCDNCKKGRPKLWIDEGKFCNYECYYDFLLKQKKNNKITYQSNILKTKGKENEFL